MEGLGWQPADGTRLPIMEAVTSTDRRFLGSAQGSQGALDCMRSLHWFCANVSVQNVAYGDFVEEVRSRSKQRQIAGEPIVFQAGFGCGIGTSLANFRRFWAVAARRNSSWAPFGPLSRSRSSLRMRLR